MNHEAALSALLQAVRDDPADPLARLALADALEECGNHEFALRYRRVGAALRLGGLATLRPLMKLLDRLWAHEANRALPWRPEDLAIPAAVPCRLALSWARPSGRTSGLGWFRFYLYSSRPRLPHVAWRDHGRTLAQGHPLEWVLLTCRRPDERPDGRGWGWYRRKTGTAKDDLAATHGPAPPRPPVHAARRPVRRPRRRRASPTRPVEVLRDPGGGARRPVLRRHRPGALRCGGMSLIFRRAATTSA